MRPPVGRLVLTLQGVELDEALIVPGRFILGRTTDNDMQIDSKFVSRHHAQLITTPDGSVLEDLNSTNGVYLNGKRVRRNKLTPGDVVKIGTHELHYMRYEAPPADDPRTTETTVLTDAHCETEGDEDGLGDDGEDNDGQSYSSIARGS